MDRIQDLSAFQGAILSADNFHSFSKLISRGGNEEKVKYVLEKLSKFLNDKNYINENGVVLERRDEYRKLALYIALNADLPILEEMTEMEGMQMVIWMIPTVPKYLLYEIFFNLHMQQFLYEIIAFSNPHLALQIADAFIVNMKYLNPVDQLDRVRIVAAALYRLICRLHFYHDGSDGDLLTDALNNFQLCINKFTNPPNADKVLNMPKDDQYKYLGRSLSIMLNLIEECMLQFTSKQEFEAEGFNEIYLGTHHPESIATKTLNFKICDSPNDAILQCLNKCHALLLDDCTTQVMSVSVDIFCAWSEYEENGKSIQQSIGELCFKLRTILQGIPSISEHTLVGMLKQISREPLNHKDIINETDIEVIVEKINAHDEESPSWLSALLYKDDLCQNLTLLLLLESNIALLKEEQSQNLFEKIIDHLHDDQENSEYLKVLAIKSFHQCNNTVKDEIITNQFSDNLHDKMENGDFATMMTEIFNKLTVSDDADPSDILTLFLQNPKQTFMKIFKLAAENEKQTDIMLRVMDSLEKYNNFYYRQDTEPCIIKVSNHVLESYLDTDVKQSNFVNFISKLKQRNIIPGNKLLMLIIMPNLHKGLINRHVIGMNVQIKLLMAAYTIEELLEFRAPMLAMLAQVLEIVRWKFTSFEAAMPPTLELALRLQQEIFNTYEAQIPEKELKWLKSKLKNLQPLNMYYYRKLWDPPGSSFIEVITGLRIRKEMDVDQITSMLLQVLCSITYQEMSEIYDGLSVFGDDTTLEILQDAVLLVTVAEKSNRTDISWACLLNCYRNFIITIKNKYFKEPLTNDQVMNVVRKLVRIVNIVDEKYVNEFAAILMPLLSYIAEKRSDYSTDIANYIQEKVKKTQFSSILNQVFISSTV